MKIEHVYPFDWETAEEEERFLFLLTRLLERAREEAGETGEEAELARHLCETVTG